MRRIRWVDDEHGQRIIAFIDGEDELPDSVRTEKSSKDKERSLRSRRLPLSLGKGQLDQPDLYRLTQCVRDLRECRRCLRCGGL